ncbi:MAG: hypothetical protein KatS3mg102_0496 [Planctomycetota bacterium]|nr:MAG: hypothetical protein KatS3mg102_0496 [Planctomycetota bacterium]
MSEQGAQSIPLAERLAERLNPVLVRELHQGVRSRAFIVALGLVLLANALAAVLIAANLSEMRPGEPFLHALTTLISALVLVVPVRALFAMVREVEPGLSEQLLLTRLRPRRIVHGQLLAAAFHIFALTGLFAPLLALTYLLRGVDVVAIVLGLGLAAGLALALAGGALALGSLARVRALAPLARALGLFGVFSGAGVATPLILEGLGDLVQWYASDPEEFRNALLGMLGALVLGLWLCELVATAMLSHPFENRSTGFRVHAWAVAAAAFGFVLAAVPQRFLDEALPAAGAVACALAAPVWLIAATEEESFSPRVRRHVPPSRLLAALAAVFLPGGGRGLLWVLCSAALLLAGGLGLPPLLAGTPADPAVAVVLAMVLLYGVLYAAVGRVVRGRMRPGLRASWLARALLLGIALLGSLLPLLLDAIVGGGIERWHPGHILDPVWTLVELRRIRRAHDPVLILGVLAALAVLAAAPSMRRGLAESWHAAAARRGRARPAPAAPAAAR